MTASISCGFEGRRGILNESMDSDSMVSICFGRAHIGQDCADARTNPGRHQQAGHERTDLEKEPERLNRRNPRRGTERHQ